MSLRLLLRDQPQRSFALVADFHALVFRHSHSYSSADAFSNASSTRSAASRCMVEFRTLGDIDLADYRTVRALGVHGTLGLISINTDVFLCIISGAARVATVRPKETVQRILSVEFCRYDPSTSCHTENLRTYLDCLNRDDFDYEVRRDFEHYSNDFDGVNAHDHGHGADLREAALEHPCVELNKIFSSGTFYYSVDFDLTNRLQDRTSEQSAFDVDNLDESFLWNSWMIQPLIDFRSRLAAPEKISLDASQILTSAIRGFVSSITIPSASSPVKLPKSSLPSSLTLISRLSCRRAGTRFNARGIDDDGNVANFVESETVLYHPSSMSFSYTQCRGSVPLFWEQTPGLLPGQQKIQITRSPEATQPAFDRHFDSLETDYGSVHILNLLSESKPGEAELTARYRHHVQHSPINQNLDLSKPSDTQMRLPESQFDFHAETKGPGGYEAASLVRRLIHERAESFAYFLCQDESYRGRTQVGERDLQLQTSTIMQQEGIFRTNCLDCLDRTNLIQNIIRSVLHKLLLPIFSL